MFMNPLLLASLAGLAAAETFRVEVGGLDTSSGTPTPILRFNPDFVNAAVGDVVEFIFKQKNHSVVQTSFGNVCHPLLGDDHAPVFASQFYPVANDATEFPTTTYTVQDASHPLWFYCSQNSHCGKAMVFSINCPIGDAPNSLDNFKAAALEFGAQEAAQASWQSTATSDVYGGYTYNPVYHPTVTETVTLDSDVWTTTYESYAGSPDPTPDAAEGNVHTVIVGKDGTLTYDPPYVAAAPRDIVRFQFVAKNHTATQSSFGNPCRKLEFTSTTGQVGFDSGFTPGSADNSPTFDVLINDTAPIWVYCRQGNHCGSGMVFSINSDESSDRNFEAFKLLAQTINGTGAAPTTSATGSVSGNAALPSTSALHAIATVVMISLGSFAALML
jgi:plastocyanin